MNLRVEPLFRSNVIQFLQDNVHMEVFVHAVQQPLLQLRGHVLSDLEPPKLPVARMNTWRTLVVYGPPPPVLDSGILLRVSISSFLLMSDVWLGNRVDHHRSSTSHIAGGLTNVFRRSLFLTSEPVLGRIRASARVALVNFWQKRRKTIR